MLSEAYAGHDPQRSTSVRIYGRRYVETAGARPIMREHNVVSAIRYQVNTEGMVCEGCTRNPNHIHISRGAIMALLDLFACERATILALDRRGKTI